MKPISFLEIFGQMKSSSKHRQRVDWLMCCEACDTARSVWGAKSVNPADGGEVRQAWTWDLVMPHR